MIDILSIRKDFPILQQEIQGKPLVYFDNAATTQKPNSVINALCSYYTTINSNIHRGVHYLSRTATEAHEEVRATVQHFVNAKHKHEIIFTRGTTESINLVAHSFGKAFLHENDEILISAMEHHSNIVPWQIICEEQKAKLKVIPINESGELVWEEFEKMLNPNVKLIAIAHVSNALGTINPIEKIIQKAHAQNIPVLIDGAQSISHLSIDVQAIDCDFYCFSGHKMYAPMGVGVLYGKEKWLNAMPPYQGGGEMIKEVTFEQTTYNELPFKFEAGTPSVGDVLGLKAAIEYISNLGMENIARYEHELLTYATDQLSSIEGIRFIGTAQEKASLISFLIKDIHPYDLGFLIDHLGIAVRTGHHCAQPLMDRFGIAGTVRASFAFYNTKEEIDSMIGAIKKVLPMLS